MPGAHLGQLAGLGQPLGPVLADGLQRLIPGAGRGHRHREQALLGQAGQRVGDRGRLQWGEPGHLRGRPGGERRDEHRNPPQQRPVRRLQQVVAPVQHRPHRPVPVVGAWPAGEDPELVGEAGGEAVQPERGPPRRRQLDRQRHTVEPLADRGDPVAYRRIGRPADRRPVHEQGDRLRPGAAGQRQWRDREHPLERHHQPGPAGHQHLHPRAGREQPFQEGRHPVAYLLAVVQHQQRLALGQRGQHRVVEAAAGLLADPHRGRDRRPDPPRIGDRDQVDEPHAIFEVTGRLRRHRQREPGLAYPARTDRGHLPVQLDRLAQLGALPCPADERRQRRGEGGCRTCLLGAAQFGRPSGQRPAIRQLQLAQQ